MSNNIINCRNVLIKKTSKKLVYVYLLFYEEESEVNDRSNDNMKLTGIDKQVVHIRWNCCLCPAVDCCRLVMMMLVDKYLCAQHEIPKLKLYHTAKKREPTTNVYVSKQVTNISLPPHLIVITF